MLSTQHDPDVTQQQIDEALREEVIKPIMPGSTWMTTPRLRQPDRHRS